MSSFFPYFCSSIEDGQRAEKNIHSLSVEQTSTLPSLFNYSSQLELFNSSWAESLNLSDISMKYLLFSIALLFFLFSCDKEDSFTTSSSDKLEFSVDTLRFDTIFTEIGSATRFFRVYNRANQSIRISNISLKGNSLSKFNLNVDGIPGDTHQEVVIYPKDSIYVFAEVTINPDDPLSISPFFVYDEVIFETNGNTQSVTLEAAGQNANYFPSRWHNDSVAVFSCNGEVVWNDPKPYVLYGIVAFVDCQLTIPAGARIHVHGGLARDEDENGEPFVYNTGRLFIGENASINVQGTIENPVIFEGDRTEDGLGFDFKNADGQWTGLIFSRGSQNNVMENAIVKNARFGIFLDSAADLSLKNVQVFNTSGPGLFAYHAQVDAENCLFYNNGSNAVQIAFGGDYNFDYCTLANYGTDASALSMTNGVCYDAECEVSAAYRLNARFRNSIIYGFLSDEIFLSDFTGNQGSDRFAFNYSFEECIIRARDINDPEQGFPDFFDWCNCFNASPSDALFVDINEDNYRLDTLSVAEEQGTPLNGIQFDLEGNGRDPLRPDLGCYEYQHN